MEVTATTPSTTLTAAPVEITTSKISSDFQTFLQMLTVQMQNQDPLNPIESSDFAVQLATFSGVEQQVRTNDLLQSMTSQMGLSGLSQLAGWVGMDARAPAPAKFEGAPIMLNATVSKGSDQAFLIVQDEYGDQIQRIEVDPENGPIEWAGVLESGDPVPLGTYNFFIESRAKGAVLNTEIADTYSNIVEARHENGQTILILDTGAEVAADQVTALRQPE